MHQGNNSLNDITRVVCYESPTKDEYKTCIGQLMYNNDTELKTMWGNDTDESNSVYDKNMVNNTI